MTGLGAAAMSYVNGAPTWLPLALAGSSILFGMAGLVAYRRLQQTPRVVIEENRPPVQTMLWLTIMDVARRRICVNADGHWVHGEAGNYARWALAALVSNHSSSVRRNIDAKEVRARVVLSKGQERFDLNPAPWIGAIWPTISLPVGHKKELILASFELNTDSRPPHFLFVGLEDKHEDEAIGPVFREIGVLNAPFTIVVSLTVDGALVGPFEIDISAPNYDCPVWKIRNPFPPMPPS